MKIRPANTIRRSFVVLAATIGLGVVTAGQADAAMTGPAEVVCTAATGTISVTPRVISDYADRDQYTATRVWVATWSPSARQWSWSAQDWKIEVASKQNSPFGHPVDRLSTQSFRAGGGFHYVYVQSVMWNGREWYGGQGAYTQTYTNVSRSVSHEPGARVQSSFCEL